MDEENWRISVEVEPLSNRISIGARVGKQDRVVGFGGRWLWIFVDSVLEQTLLLKMFLLVFLVLFLVSGCYFTCALRMNNHI